MLLRSRVPLVVIETYDEPRALEMLAALSPRLAAAHTPVFQWTCTDGLRRLDVNLGGSQQHNAEPAAVLKSIRASSVAGIYVLLDFHPFLGDPVHVRLLKDICQDYDRTARTIVLISDEIALPRELEHLAARFRLAFPDRAERRGNHRESRRTSGRARTASKVRTDRKSLELLIENLAGLSVGDTERLARQAIFNDGALMPSDLPGVMQAKYELLNRGGVLQLRVRHGALRRPRRHGAPARSGCSCASRPSTARAPELEPPKGVLLLGVQGCGKSVAARAAAGISACRCCGWTSARSTTSTSASRSATCARRCATAGLMAPCVLWIDEIEKGLATGDGDSGTSRRLLGAFLTWLAERKSKVFVVATANDIAALPPELMRKGRFDEIFFVDLPDPATRAEILRIHAAQALAAARAIRRCCSWLALRRVLGRGDRAGGRVRRLRSACRRTHGRRAGHPAGDRMTHGRCRS